MLPRTHTEIKKDTVDGQQDYREGENLRPMCIFIEIIVIPITKARTTD